MQNEENQQSTPQTETSAPTADTPLPKPKCPSCGADPIAILGRSFNIGRFKFLLPFCTQCRNLVPAILVEIAEPVIQRAPGPMIHEH